MKRFNLLLINTDAGLGHRILKTITKVFKRNFVFEVEDLEEAINLIQKLQIDLVMVDLDKLDMDFTALNERYPELILMGISEKPSMINSRINVYRHHVFKKADFVGDMLTELKSIRKDLQMGKSLAPEAKKLQTPAGSEDFKDFFKLVAMN